MTTDQFYQRVGQVEHKELVDFIDRNQTEFALKISDQYIKANVNYVKTAKYFSFLKFHDFEFSNEPVLCTFMYKDDIFIFSSYLSSTKLDYVIEIPQEIYQLQRRNDFRINIPIGLIYHCHVTFLKGHSTAIKAELRDLSMGGCQLSIPAFKADINPGDEFSISINMDKFEFADLRLAVKHIKKIEDQDILLIGSQFTDLVGETANDMRSLIMMLDRKSRGKS